MENKESRAIEILLVEDNPSDARITENAFQEADFANNLHHVKDGIEALNFLRQVAPFQNAPRPDLVLLDLNLPKLSGMEVLQIIKTDQLLRRIPVIILSQSSANEDILASYDYYANAYVTKPVDLTKFMKIIRLVEDFWVRIVKLPPS